MYVKGNLILLLVAFIWGTTFVAQHSGMDSLGPFSYAAARFFLGFLSMLLLVFFTNKTKTTRQKDLRKNSIRAGFICGIIMFISLSLQQIGMLYTSAGKTAFIACLYIILVPLFSVFLHKKIAKGTFLGAFIAIVGLYLLSVKDGLSFEPGDIIVLFSSVFGAIHILCIGKYAANIDAIEMSAVQIFICFLLSTCFALAFESPSLNNLQKESIPIFYGGIVSVGISYTLQIIGQQYASPSDAAIIMSLESVFGALSSWLFLHESMTNAEIFGCFLMLSGMLITQLGNKINRQQKNPNN